MALLSNCRERLPVFTIFAIFNVIGFLILSFLTVKFIINHNKASQTTKNTLELAPFILVILISIICMALHLIWIPYSFICNPQQSILEIIRSLLGALEVFFIILLWYIRLYLTFRNSAQALSSITRIFWYIYFLVGSAAPISYVVGAILLTTNYIDAQILGFITVFCIMVMIVGIVSLTTLFVIKLFQTYKYCGTDETFINIITRIAILTIASFGVTILSSIVTPIYLNVFFGNIYGEFVKDWFTAFDNFTNCLFMLLSFSYYDGIYSKLCSCIHVRCNQCWIKCAGSEEVRRLSKGADLQMNVIAATPTSIDSEQQI